MIHVSQQNVSHILVSRLSAEGALHQTDADKALGLGLHVWHVRRNTPSAHEGQSLNRVNSQEQVPPPLLHLGLLYVLKKSETQMCHLGGGLHRANPHRSFLFLL